MTLYKLKLSKLSSVFTGTYYDNDHYAQRTTAAVFITLVYLEQQLLCR